MTNRERVLALIRSEPTGLADSEIRERTGIEPHQQVNQICRGLAQQGLTERRPGPDGRLRNLPAGAPQGHPRSDRCSPPPVGPETRSHKRASPADAAGVPRLSISETLFILPCSGAKRQGGRRTASSGTSVLHSLPRSLAAELRNRRAENAPRAKLDKSALRPAAERYTGALYQAAGDALDVLVGAAAGVLIISGGYGVVHPMEPIGWYDQEFRNSMWPNAIVAQCLAAFATVAGATAVVGLLSRTTQYAQVFRRVQWPDGVEHVFHVWPQPVPGAMVKAPRALGEALKAFSRDCYLHPGWKSSDGVEMGMTRLR